MKTYTWQRGVISEGIALKNDERLGQVIFLGEEGRGRRYEKVALGRRNPAKVISGRVHEAQPEKIVLPVKNEKTEKVFFVLEKPTTGTDNVLVRINTETSYVRGAHGHVVTVAGNPETITGGYGAYGDAGRIGTWTDSLVIVRTGDVLRVYPSRGSSNALWLENGKPVTAPWQDYENLQAVATAETRLAEADTSEALKPVFGQMPAFTYVGKGEIRSGLQVSTGTTGPVIALGERGRGRKLTEVPIVGCETSGRLESAAVVQLTDTIYGLTVSDQTDDGILVRVTAKSSVHREYWRTKILRGEPTKLAEGMFAGGHAGYAGSVDDTLWVLGTGDAVVVEGSKKFRVIENENGNAVATKWDEWEIADAAKDPKSYAEGGKTPWGYVPTDWIGKVVSIQEIREENINGDVVMSMLDVATGELVSTNPMVLNLGWDGRDRVEQTFIAGTWVKLEMDMEVHQLEGEALTEREALKAQAEILRAKATEALNSDWFAVLDSNQQEKLQKLACEDGFAVMGNPDDPYSYDRPRLTDWISNAESVLSGVEEVSQKTAEILRQQEAGEVITHFEAWHRRGGMTGNGDGWVILPDGSLRKPDSNTIPRHKSDGYLYWDLVAKEELALLWRCNHMRNVSDNSTFEVAKIPVGGPTEAQLETIQRIEAEIGAPEGAFGFQCWRDDAPKEEVPAESEEPLKGESLEDAVERLRERFGK